MSALVATGGRCGRRRAVGARLALALAGAGAAAPLGAQQYITDDAGLTEHRACQIQMWVGQRSSWVLPVCTPARNLELSAGFIAVWEDGSDGHFEYVLQAKTLLRPLTTNGWGAGLVAGVGRDPALASTADEIAAYYVYVPLSRSLAGDRVVLHQNTGWILQRGAGRDRHGVSWAARADVAAARNLTLVGELYGAEGAARAPAEFQAGVRSFARPGRVQLDLSYGGRLRTGRRAQGWTLGLTLITPAFL